jgi:hypothetical protein
MLNLFDHLTASVREARVRLQPAKGACMSRELLERDVPQLAACLRDIDPGLLLAMPRGLLRY